MIYIVLQICCILNTIDDQGSKSSFFFKLAASCISQDFLTSVVPVDAHSWTSGGKGQVSQLAGLPFAGPCSVCPSLEGLKIAQPWIPDRADIWPDIAMGNTLTAAVVSHKARREERQDWKRRGDESQEVYDTHFHRRLREST